MKNTTRIALGLGAALVVASGGSAFTAANTSSETELDVGYNSVDVTGISISNIAYVQQVSNISLLDKVVFTATQNVTGAGYAIKMTLNGPTNTATTCTAALLVITCDMATNVPYASVDSVQLNVSPV